MDFKFLPLLLAMLLAGSFIFPKSIQAQDNSENIPDQKSTELNISKFRFAIDGGPGYLLGNTKTAKETLASYGISKTEIDKYYKDLKLGEQFGVSAHYLVNDKYGLGLDYRIFTTKSNTMGFIDSPDTYSTFYGPLSEKIYTNFAGISYFSQQKLQNERWNIYSSVALGWAFYHNESNLIVSPVLLEGNSFATNYNLGIEYRLSKHIALGAGLECFYSVLHKFQLNNGQTTTEIKLNKEQRENLSRLNLTAGIHFYL
ncbi:MAG: hypothetical protein WAO52_05865 [Prolixibacteraceae bacterium]